VQLGGRHRKSLVQGTRADEEYREYAATPHGIGLKLTVDPSRDSRQSGKPSGEHGNGGDEQQVGDALGPVPELLAKGEAAAGCFEVAKPLLNGHAVAVMFYHAPSGVSLIRLFSHRACICGQETDSDLCKN
jgi:hypothetical protein